MLYYKIINSPIGKLKLIADKEKLHKVVWENYFGNAFFDDLSSIDKTNDLLELAAIQFSEYFSKKRKFFELPLYINGNNFEIKSWNFLQTIPYGETISYGEMAKQIGHNGAQRAVGMANAKNKIPIIIPCHRVVSSTGHLHGFASGLQNKQILLELEGITVKNFKINNRNIK